MDSDTKPMCGRCRRELTPENAQLFPELFLHDACLPNRLNAELTRRAKQLAQILCEEERAVRREILRDKAAVAICAALVRELLTCPERAATPLEVADMAVELAEALVGRLAKEPERGALENG